MGNGAGVPSKDSRQIASTDSDHTTLQVTKTQNIGGLARLAEAKSKFMNTQGRREALRASKQVNHVQHNLYVIVNCFELYQLHTI